MQALETKLGYTFRRPALLENALYHSSYANEHRAGGITSNERLEFPSTSPRRRPSARWDSTSATVPWVTSSP